MSSTRYNLGPNITYRLLTEPSELDIIWECSGWDKSSSKVTDPNDPNCWHSVPDFETMLPHSKAFEDGWVTKTGTQQDYNIVVYLFECDGNPMAVFCAEVCKINAGNARDFGMASRLDEMTGKWAHTSLWRYLHPNYRGIGFNDFTVRGNRSFFVSDFGFNFCDADLTFSNRVSVQGLGLPPSQREQALLSEDTGTNTDQLNYFKNIHDSYLSRPDEFEVITKPEWFGDFKIFVDKTASLTRRQCLIPELSQKSIPYWMVSDSDWAKACRELCEFEWDSINGTTAYFDFMKLFDFRDENGDLYYELPDYTKLSYDTSEQKFYINEPGYDFIEYQRNNIDISSVRKSTEKTAQLLSKYKNI